MIAGLAARIGANIRRLRDQRGLSQGGLARRVGEKTDGNTISRWEKGRNAPSWESMLALARVFDVDISALLKPVNGPEDAATVERELTDAGQQPDTPTRSKRGTDDAPPAANAA